MDEISKLDSRGGVKQSKWTYIAGAVLLIAALFAVGYTGFVKQPAATTTTTTLAPTTSTLTQTTTTQASAAPTTSTLSEAQMKVCTSDSDCVSADAGCCGCTMGGQATAVARSYKDVWEDKIASECAAVLCPAVISNHPTCHMRPECIDGRCELVGEATTTTLKVNCTMNADCGQKTSERVCYRGDVYVKTENPRCVKPGSSNSYCTTEVDMGLTPINRCSASTQTCVEGECVVNADN